MTNTAVQSFCAIVANDDSLQKELCEAINNNQGLERFVELALEQGHEVTLETARACFAAERQRREATESEEHAETVVVNSQHPVLESNEESDPGRAGFRRVALSGNWQIGDANSSQSESIHD